MMNGSNIDKIEIDTFGGKIRAHIIFATGNPMDVIGEDSVNSAIDQLANERGRSVMAMLLGSANSRPIVISDKVWNKYDFVGSKFVDKVKYAKQQKAAQTPKPASQNTRGATPAPQPAPQNTRGATPAPQPAPQNTNGATPTPQPAPQNTNGATPAPQPAPQNTNGATPAPQPAPQNTNGATPTPQPAPQNTNSNANRRSNVFMRGIRNLKLNAPRIATYATVGCLLIGGVFLLQQCHNNGVTYNNSKDSTTHAPYEQQYETPNVGYLYENNGYEAEQANGYYGFETAPTYEYQDVESKVDAANESCFRNIGDLYNFINGAGSLNENMQPCDAQNYVSGDDYAAINAIVNARNSVVEEAYSLRSVPITQTSAFVFMSQFVNYVFENGTTFNGTPVKSFDSLDPYSQYVVVTLGHGILQLRPDYEYSSTNRNYKYSNLMDDLEGILNQTRSSLDGRHY